MTSREAARSDGVDSDDTDAIEERLQHLVDDDDFWEQTSESLAIFAGPNRFETHRLPNQLVASVTVSDRFHVVPLLRTTTFPQAAWVLALSQGANRLLEIGPSGPPREVTVPDMPSDAWDSSGNKVHRAREGAYASKLDAALRSVLSGSTLPLILAASQPMAALYRSVNTYPHLVTEREHGNQEDTSDADLAAAAREILDEVYAQQLEDLASVFDDRRSQGRTAVDISDIARLATMGAVDTVMIDMDETVSGTIDESGAVTFSDGDDHDLFDEIARRVLMTDGRVMALRSDDIVGDGPIAAILRFVP